MTFKDVPKLIFWGIIGAIVVSLLGLTLPFILSPRFTFLERIGLAQLSFSAIAFFVIFITLVLTLVQFSKSMAKPLIKVAFNENGEQTTDQLTSLWLINCGNAVARYFQIDFFIPENIAKSSAVISMIPWTSLDREGGKYILRYTNEGRYTLFVNRPYRDPDIPFSAVIAIDKCVEDKLEIVYRIYGDWTEPREGKLKVICKKS